MTKLERTALKAVIDVLVGNNDIVRTRGMLDEAIDNRNYAYASELQETIKELKSKIPSPTRLEELRSLLESQEDLENET